MCSEECGSGGVSQLEHSVGEDLPFEEGEDQGGSIEFAPVLGGGVGELEHHDQSALPGSIPIGASVSQANGREGAFNRVGRPQVSPVLRWEVVEIEKGITILLERHARLVVLDSVFGQEVIERLRCRLPMSAGTQNRPVRGA